MKTRAKNPKSGAINVTCKHCGTPSRGEEFCCGGCAYVYRLIHDSGLDQYYRLKDQVTLPAEGVLETRRDFTWLSEAMRECEAKSPAGTCTLSLDVQGISCAGCVWLIERVFERSQGAGRIEVDAQAGQMQWTWFKGQFDAVALAATLHSLNYLVSPASAARSAPPESRGLVIRIGLCTAFAMNIMLFALPAYFGMEAGHEYAGLFQTLSLVFATLSVLVGGTHFFTRARVALSVGVMSIDLPIALGILGSYGGSVIGWGLGAERYVYFDFVGTFIVLMLVGRWAQVAAVERNQRRLLARQPVPPRLRVINEAGEATLAVPSSLTEGARYFVENGQHVPVESRVLGGPALVSLAWINGESTPKEFSRGERIPAGGLYVGRGTLELRAEEPWERSLMAELLKPLERGESRHRFIERVITGYIWGILGIALTAGVAWASLTGDPLRTGAVVVAVLVVSCPCAIGLAFPLVEELAIVELRRSGLFVRVPDLWHRLANIRTVIFDKTGTLTSETPRLANPSAMDGLAAEDRAALYSLVCDNAHPVARSLHERFAWQGRPAMLEGDWDETPGCGVEWHCPHASWSLGRAGWRSLDGKAEDGTEFCRNGVVLARFHFEEAVRPDASEEVTALLARGLAVRILSGDSKDKVDTIGGRLSLAPDSCESDHTPRSKAKRVQEWGGDAAMMIGDGANDSLAFDQAGVRGTPVVHRGTLESKADFYFLGRGIAGVRALFEVNEVRRRTQRMLLAFSIGYNALAVGLAVTGHMNPLLAAILMPLSSLVSLAIVGAGMKCRRR